MLARLLLCEHNAQLATILIDLFKDENIAVRPCESLEEIEAAIDEEPDAIVLTDSWTGSWAPQLCPLERDAIKRLGERTYVVVTTGRAWAQHAVQGALGRRVAVIAKPYDLDEVVGAVRNALALQSDR